MEPISSVALAVKEALSLVRDLINPENQKGLDYIKRLRNLGRAVNYAERAFACVDEMMQHDVGSKSYERCLEKYKDNKEKFNKYD